MDQFPNFAGLKAFFALGHHGNLSDAGSRLGVSASAISHQIKNLEADLGQRLVENRNGRLFLTAEGNAFFDQIREPMAEISRATSSIRSRGGRTRVTITLTPVFAANWFMPRMKQLVEAYPDLELNLVTTTRIIDLERENIDFAIRRGRTEWPGFASQVLLEEQIVLVASPAYAETLAGSDLQSFLGSAQLLINTTLPAEWQDWCHVQGVDLPRDARRFNLETYELTINAARDGLGVALGRRPMMDEFLANGSLVVLFEGAHSDFVQHRLVWSENRSLGAPAKKVREWLVREAA